MSFSTTLNNRCCACNEEAAETALLPCFHMLCRACLDAEETIVVCPFKLDSVVSCGYKASCADAVLVPNNTKLVDEPDEAIRCSVCRQPFTELNVALKHGHNGLVIPGVEREMIRILISQTYYTILLDGEDATRVSDKGLRYARNLLKIIDDAAAKLIAHRGKLEDAVATSKIDADIKTLQQQSDEVLVAIGRLNACFNAALDKSVRLSVRSKAVQQFEVTVDSLTTMKLLKATSIFESNKCNVYWPLTDKTDLWTREIDLSLPFDAAQFSVKFTLDNTVPRLQRACIDLNEHGNFDGNTSGLLVTRDGYVVVQRSTGLTVELLVFTLDGTFVNKIEFTHKLHGISTIAPKGLAIVKQESPKVLILFEVATGEEYEQIDLTAIPNDTIPDDFGGIYNGSSVVGIKFVMTISAAASSNGSVYLLADIVLGDDDELPAVLTWSALSHKFAFVCLVDLDIEIEHNKGVSAAFFAGYLTFEYFTEDYAYIREVGHNERYYRLPLSNGFETYLGSRDQPHLIHSADSSIYDPASRLTLHAASRNGMSDIVLHQEIQQEHDRVLSHLVGSFAGFPFQPDAETLNAHLEGIRRLVIPPTVHKVFRGRFDRFALGPEGELAIFQGEKGKINIF